MESELAVGGRVSQVFGQFMSRFILFTGIVVILPTRYGMPSLNVHISVSNEDNQTVPGR
jgi:hypothetical protein